MPFARTCPSQSLWVSQTGQAPSLQEFLCNLFGGGVANLWIFLFLRSFRIIRLGTKSRKIFEFKGLICKMSRNKDLATSVAWVPPGPPITPMRKGRGNVPRPFLAIPPFIISIPTYPHRQVLLLYFLHRFIDLRGKSPGWGLDKISGGGTVWKTHSPSGYHLAKAPARDIIQLHGNRSGSCKSARDGA